MTNTDLIKCYATVAPYHICRHFKPDCCIGATRITVGVLGRLGLNVYAQPVRFNVYTKSLWDRLTTFDGTFRDGDWSVGIGYGEDPRKKDTNWKGYDGHLVALVHDYASEGTGATFLLDMSIGQASRPKKGIVLPNAAIIERRRLEWPIVSEINRCVCRWQHHVNPAYVDSPDWKEPERTAPIIEAILKEMAA